MKALILTCLAVAIMVAALVVWFDGNDEGKPVDSGLSSRENSGERGRLPFHDSSVVEVQPLESRGHDEENSAAEKLARLKSVISQGRQNRSVPFGENSKEGAERFASRVWQAKRFDFLGLLNSWGLNPETIAKVESILSNREIALGKIDFEMDQTPFQSPESKRLIGERKRVQLDADAGLESLLGADRVGELKRWEESRKERRTLERTTLALKAIDPLTENQEQRLLDVLFQEKKSRSIKLGESTLEAGRGGHFAEAVVSKLAKELRPDQLRVLKEILASEDPRRQGR